MTKTLATIAAIAVLAGCTAEETIPLSAGPALGFNPEDFDPSVRPQDDFYSYINGRWLSATEIPAEWSSYGVMQILYEETEQQLRELIEEAVDPETNSEDSEIRKIGDLYASFTNEPLAETLGMHGADRGTAIVH